MMAFDESNKILFVENLPENFNEESVANIFGQLQGYKESRMVSGNSSIAFVEFSNESFASVAKNIMNNHRIDLHMNFVSRLLKNESPTFL